MPTPLARPPTLPRSMPSCMHSTKPFPERLASRETGTDSDLSCYRVGALCR